MAKDTCPIDPTDFSITFECECPRCKSRLFGILGFAGAAIFLTGIIVSVLSWPGFDWARQFISDLGESSSSPGASTFNGCFIVSGVFFMFFSFLFLAIPTKYRQFTFGAFFFGFMHGLATTITGCSPMDGMPLPHEMIAVLFFVGMLFSSISLSLAIFFQGKDRQNIPRSFGFFGMIAFVLTVILVILAAVEGVIIDIASRPSPYPMAIVEWIAILVHVSWVFALSIYELY